jgi:hypothetical protein
MYIQYATMFPYYNYNFLFFNNKSNKNQFSHILEIKLITVQAYVMLYRKTTTKFYVDLFRYHLSKTFILLIAYYLTF